MIPDMRNIYKCEYNEILTVGDIKKLSSDYDDCPILDYENPDSCHLYSIYAGTEYDVLFFGIVQDDELVKQTLENRKGE